MTETQPGPGRATTSPTIVAELQLLLVIFSNAKDFRCGYQPEGVGAVTSHLPPGPGERKVAPAKPGRAALVTAPTYGETHDKQTVGRGRWWHGRAPGS